METETLVWVIGGILLLLWFLLFIGLISICIQVKNISEKLTKPNDNQQGPKPRALVNPVDDSASFYGSPSILPGEELSQRGYTTRPPHNDMSHPPKNLPMGHKPGYDNPSYERNVSQNQNRHKPSMMPLPPNTHHGYNMDSNQRGGNNNFMY